MPNVSINVIAMSMALERASLRAISRRRNGKVAIITTALQDRTPRFFFE